MSTPADPIQTFATAEQANIAATAAALTNIATGVGGLDTLIQQLQASLASGSGGSTVSAADQTLLNNVVAASGALVTQAQAISTTPPAPTPPAVPVP